MGTTVFHVEQGFHVEQDGMGLMSLYSESICDECGELVSACSCEYCVQCGELLDECECEDDE
jgi:hypothetical protein